MLKIIDPDAGEKKFFYDNFNESDVAGMFGIYHLLYVLLFIGIAALLLFLSRKLTAGDMPRVRFIIAVALTAMEIAKVSLRIFKNQWYDSWVPLYYCSLFIFAIWCTFAKVDFIRKMGFAYITMGGIIASAFFMLYPSTSLAIYPALHPSVMHSFIYHLVMFYTGLMILITREYEPQSFDALPYFCLILLASVPSVFLNESLGTNCMFLRHAFKLPILEPIINYSKYLYMAVVFLAQSSLMFWGNYLFYNIAKRKVKTK